MKKLLLRPPMSAANEGLKNNLYPQIIATYTSEPVKKRFSGCQPTKDCYNKGTIKGHSKILIYP
jgi:hypothetical protein